MLPLRDCAFAGPVDWGASSPSQTSVSEAGTWSFCKLYVPTRKKDGKARQNSTQLGGRSSSNDWVDTVGVMFSFKMAMILGFSPGSVKKTLDLLGNLVLLIACCGCDHIAFSGQGPTVLKSPWGHS